MYRIDTEGIRVHTRVACENGNGVVIYAKELYKFPSKKFECNTRMIMKSETIIYGGSGYRTSNRCIPFIYHAESSLPESSQSISTSDT